MLLARGRMAALAADVAAVLAAQAAPETDERVALSLGDEDCCAGDPSAA